MPDLKQNVVFNVVGLDDIQKVEEKVRQIHEEEKKQQVTQDKKIKKENEHQSQLRKQVQTKNKHVQLEKKLVDHSEKLARQHELLTRESEKTARLAQESLRYEREDLRLAEKKLRSLKEGTAEYKKQHREVRRIQQRIQTAENKALTAGRRRAAQLSGRIGSQDWISGNIFLDTLYGRLGGAGRIAQGITSRAGSAGGAGGLGVGKTFALGGGALVGAGVAIALQKATVAAARWEVQLKEIQKTTGLTNQETDRLGDELLDLSAHLGTAKQDLAEIAEAGGQLGVRGVENLREYTRQVAMLASVTDLAADEAGQAIGFLSKVFDIPISQIRNMTSALNALEDTTIANVPSIVEGLRKVAAIATALGIELSETAGIVATLIGGGFKPEEAGTGLRNIFLTMQSETEKVADAMKITKSEYVKMLNADPVGTFNAMLVALQGMDKIARTEFVAKLFGKRQAAQVTFLATNISGLTENMSLANEEFAKGTNALQTYVTQTDTAVNKVKRLWGGFVDTMIQVGEKTLEAITPFLDGMVRLMGLDVDESTIEGLETLRDRAKSKQQNLLTLLEGEEDQRTRDRINENLVRLRDEILDYNDQIRSIREELNEPIEAVIADGTADGTGDGTGDEKVPPKFKAVIPEAPELVLSIREKIGPELAEAVAEAIEMLGPKALGRAEFNRFMAEGPPEHEDDYDRDEDLKADADALLESVERLHDVGGSVLQIISDLGGASRVFTNLNSETKKFVGELVNGVDAAFELAGQIKAIGGLRNFGSLDFAGKASMVASGVGIATSLIGIFDSFFGNKQEEEEELDDLSAVSVSRSLTEVQANSAILLAQRQVYLLEEMTMLARERNRMLNNSFTPSGRSFNPDNSQNGQLLGQAMDTYVRKSMVRR